MQFRQSAAILTALGLMIGAAASGGAAYGAVAQPKTVLLYGDSLMSESKQYVVDQLNVKAQPWNLIDRTYGGTAPCDWNPTLDLYLFFNRPSVVTLETAGNNLTPCMTDSNGNQLLMGSTEYFAKNRADLEYFLARATAGGAKVVYFNNPPFLNPTWNAAANQIDSMVAQLATQFHGVSISNVAAKSVAKNGTQYTAYKPCQTGETAAMGCGPDRQIAVRTVVGSQTGIHFCPAGLPQALPHDCETYSSGERRWGRAVANAIASPPRPVLP